MRASLNTVALNTIALRAAFVLTGVGVAVLGAALPAMLAEWNLSDRGGGSLLLSSFAGSTLGALLVRGKLHLLASLGLAATAVAATLLAESKGAMLHPAFLLYGTGLGVAMTAISLLRSRAVPRADSNLEMNRLNLLWALGACFAPAMALRSLHVVSVRTLFLSEAVAMAGAAGLLILTRTADAAVEASGPASSLSLSRSVPVRLCLFAAAAVALETAVGGWLTTYTERVAHGVGVAVWANSAFWFGLLLSRGLHSFRSVRWLEAGWVTATHVAAVTLAVLLLVAAPFESMLPAAALFAGLGLGPLYPLALSIALPRYHSNAIFVATGLGAALLPWITGTLSTALGSLRSGLLAPCATVLILLATGLSIRRQLSESA